MARAYLTRALAYASQQITDKALADFNAAIREDPRMARAYYNRGVLFAKQLQFGCGHQGLRGGKHVAARRCLVRSSVGQCYEQKGDRILANKYHAIWREKAKKANQEQEEYSAPLPISW